MPRTFNKVLGPTRRQKYSEAQLEKAVKEVRRGKLSARSASEKYGIPRATIGDKLRGCHELKMGRPTAFSSAEEQNLVECLLLCSSWGFPLQPTDIKNIVQSALNRDGRKVLQFENNRPGREWMLGFLSRHKDLSVRFSENIKRVRAQISKEMIENYFIHLEKSLQDVPASNILNYDETNFSDDPGKVKVIVRRGVRHSERIIDHSKTSTSVMMACTATGVLLPPYVVYKAQYIYPTWIENGITNSAYNANKSGWFDLRIFEDWFQTICLPYLKNLPGKKAMIGDNLSSHLSLHVIRLCEENNIQFILLPPNATHICQPLDVAFFRPMKIAWRSVLSEWKEKNRGVIPKSQFPSLLKSAVEKMSDKMEENIKSGFRACGIYPLNKQKVLQHIPGAVEDQSAGTWNAAVIEHLQKYREGEKPKVPPRGPRLNVSPGQSVQVRHIPGASTSANDAVAEEEIVDDPGEVLNSDNESVGSTESDSAGLSQANESVVLPEEPFKEKDFVLVKFPTDKRTRLFVGQVKKIKDRGSTLEVQFMRKRKTNTGKEYHFTFPIIDDISIVKLQQIQKKLVMRDLRRGRLICTSDIQFDLVE